MKLYPLYVRLEGRLCTVIGGGEVAEHKVLGLISAGARVRVVSPTLTSRLRTLAQTDAIDHVERGYQHGDLADSFIAFATTDDESVNAGVAAEAREHGVMLNAADRPSLCDFVSPAVLERGDLLIATSTSGASPMMARRIREQLELQFGLEYADALEILRAARRRLAAEGRSSAERRRVLAALVDSPLLDLLRRRDRAGIDRVLAETLGGGYTIESLAEV